MDLFDWHFAALPPESQGKLQRFAEDQQAAWAAYRDASDREREAAFEVTRVRGIVAANHGRAAEDQPVVTAAAAVAEYLDRAQGAAAERARAEAAAKAREPIERAGRRRQVAADARERAEERLAQFAFLDPCVSWLERATRGGVTLRHFAPAPPKAKDTLAAIERARADLAALDDEWAAAEAAPVPRDVLLAQAIAEIDEIAARGALTIDPTNRSGTPVGLDRRMALVEQPVPGLGGAVDFRVIGDAGSSVFTWLHREMLVERVTKIIGALPQDGALTDPERDKWFRSISDRRLEVERIEEALILLAAAEGRQVPRRRDADPRAVLEVKEA